LSLFKNIVAQFCVNGTVKHYGTMCAQNSHTKYLKI